MAVKTLGNVGLKAEWKLGSTAWKDDNDRNMRGLDVLVQCVASAAPTNTPPSSPADGSLWMVDSAPTGAWAGQAGKLARYDSGNSDDGRAASWEFWTPKGGWECVFSNASNNHEIYRCLAVPGVGFGWFLYATMSTTAFNAAAFQAYGSNANTLNNNGLAIWSGTTFVAGMESTGVATAMSYRTQSGNVERISNAGAAYFTVLTVSGLTQYKIPRVLTAGGQLGDSCFGDDGTTATCSRTLRLPNGTISSGSGISGTTFTLSDATSGIVTGYYSGTTNVVLPTSVSECKEVAIITSLAQSLTFTGQAGGPGVIIFSGGVYTTVSAGTTSAAFSGPKKFVITKTLDHWHVVVQ